MTEREKLLEILYDMPEVQTLKENADYLLEHGVTFINHGHWIKTGGYVCGDYEFKCSACGETYWEGSNYAERAHFCLNCGAKMIFAVRKIKKE